MHDRGVMHRDVKVPLRLPPRPPRPAGARAASTLRGSMKPSGVAVPGREGLHVPASCCAHSVCLRKRIVKARAALPFAVEARAASPFTAPHLCAGSQRAGGRERRCVPGRLRGGGLSPPLLPPSRPRPPALPALRSARDQLECRGWMRVKQTPSAVCRVGWGTALQWHASGEAAAARVGGRGGSGARRRAGGPHGACVGPQQQGRPGAGARAGSPQGRAVRLHRNPLLDGARGGARPPPASQLVGPPADAPWGGAIWPDCGCRSQVVNPDEEVGYDERADIWSFGILLLEMAHGEVARLPPLPPCPAPKPHHGAAGVQGEPRSAERADGR